MSTTVNFVAQMSCEKCANAIREKFKDVKEVKKVEINLELGSVVVESTLPTNEVLKLIQSTGRKAAVKGIGGLLAAVTILENGQLKGVIRFSQNFENACSVDGTVDGLKTGNYFLQIHESGDLSMECSRVGGVYKSETTNGLIAKIDADERGRATFRTMHKPLNLSEVIGRTVVISSSDGKKLGCGIIARSSGLFDNPKMFCACDGISLWDETQKK